MICILQSVSLPRSNVSRRDTRRQNRAEYFSLPALHLLSCCVSTCLNSDAADADSSTARYVKRDETCVVTKLRM
jgi:hypothetical protein